MYGRGEYHVHFILLSLAIEIHQNYHLYNAKSMAELSYSKKGRDLGVERSLVV